MNEENIIKLHVITGISLFIFLLIITFSSDNPVIIFLVYLFIIVIFITTKNLKRLRNVMFYFIPVAALIIIINMLTVNYGSHIILTIAGRRITIEALIYGIIMSFKYLSVIFIFIFFEMSIDSDAAVSYFSEKLPKSTLTLMLIFKLIPNIKKKFYGLVDIYKIRGVDFGKKHGKDIKSYIPVMHVLLESCLEGSFDVGEAAYVRGFLSCKRSVYDKKKLNKKDIFILILIAVLLFSFIYFISNSYFEFKLYENISYSSFINFGTIYITLGMIILTAFITKCKENKNGLYRD